MNIPKTHLPRIVIIGGGFAGISLARELAHKNLQIVLLDKHNYHTFQPLLYQVATGGLEPDSIAYPIRKVIKDLPNFYFRMGKVLEIDTNKNKVIADIGEVKYDYLVLATGSTTNFFGNKNIEAHAMVMKTVPQSLNLRSMILENFEQALLTKDIEERNALMNFVIVGGGPTGVELAGALAEIKKGILPKDYPDLDIRQMQINLVQGSDRLLDAMCKRSSEKAEEFLVKLGVNIWKNLRVTNYDGYLATTNTDVTFETATLVWAAGVMGEKPNGFEGEELIGRGNRIRVNTFNQVLGYNNVFAIGDIALMESEEHPNGFPMMVQPAMQQGEHLAQNLTKLINGKEMTPFVYKNKGSMATVGRNKAVVDLPKFTFQGIFAWFVWMFIHLFYLIGARNRVVVFVNWVYNYVKFDREARLIIRPYKKNRKIATVE